MCFDVRLDVCAGTCIGMRSDVCADMCVDVCVNVCVDMCANLCVDVCVDMYVDVTSTLATDDRLLCIDMCIDICADMSADMCADMCIGMWLRAAMIPGVRGVGVIGLLGRYCIWQNHRGIIGYLGAMMGYCRKAAADYCRHQTTVYSDIPRQRLGYY